MYASSGNAQMASDSFAKALHYAEQDPDPYAKSSILHSHAMSASMLGRTELAAYLVFAGVERGARSESRVERCLYFARVRASIQPPGQPAFGPCLR